MHFTSGAGATSSIETASESRTARMDDMRPRREGSVLRDDIDSCEGDLRRLARTIGPDEDDEDEEDDEDDDSGSVGGTHSLLSLRDILQNTGP